MNERIVVHPPSKDKSGKFYITVSYYINGVRKQKRKSGFVRSKDAKLYGEEIKKRLEEEMPVIKATGSEHATFNDFVEKYTLIMESTWSANTYKVRKQSLKHCDFKNKEIMQITKMDLAMNVKRLEALYSYGTVRSLLSSWKVYLNAAVEYNYLVVAPNYKLQNQGEDIAVENVLSIEDAYGHTERITDREVHLLTLIGFTCGARMGEALDINLNDIDYSTGIWKIHHQYQYAKKGHKHYQKVKTKNSYREVPIPNSTLKAIKEYPFRTLEGFIFNKPSALMQRVNPMYKDLEIPVTFHGLRHTYITNLIRSKQFDIQSIAKLAGDTVDMILKTYSHYLKETQKENIEKINIVFG